VEKDNFKIDIDMAEFHGLSADENTNPYKAPVSSPHSFLTSGYVKLGFWSYFATFLVVSWLAFISYILINIAFSSSEKISLFLIALISLSSLLAISHFLVLFKVEFAKKIAVFHSYFLLLGIPIGTVVGIILLKNLRGKKFIKTL
jgi:hypothetical protein